MLNFWYSPRCTRQIKLFACVVTFAVLYFTGQSAKIPSELALSSLGLGFILHLAYQLSLKPRLFSKRRTFNLIYQSLIIVIVLGLIWLSPSTLNKLFVTLQVIGYTLLGFFLISIYTQRSPRHDKPI